MSRHPLLLVCLLAPCPALAGCHIIAGFDSLELREDPAPLWSRVFGDEEGSEQVRALGVNQGRIIVAGSYDLGVDLGLGPLPEPPGGDPPVEYGFVGVLDASGTAQLSYALGASGGSRPVSLAGPVLAGFFSGTLAVEDESGAAAVKDREGEDLSVGEGEHAVYLLELGADGTVAYGSQFGGAGFGSSGDKLDVARDSAGGTIIGGGFFGSVQFGTATTEEASCGKHTSGSGLSNLFIAKLDQDGKCVWSFHNADTQPQAVESVAVDLGRSFVVAGEFAGNLKFPGGDELQGSGGIDFFLARFDENGNHKFSRSFGDSGRVQSSARVASHLFGISALAGYFDGRLDLGGGPIQSNQGHDLFVAKFDPNGNHIWTRHYPVRRKPCSADDCDLDKIDIVFDGAGNLLVAGHFSGTVDFGGTTLTSEGGSIDLFLAKLDGDGELLWSGRFGDATDQCELQHCAAHLGLDADRNVLLGGYLEGDADFGAGPLGGGSLRNAFVAKFGP